MRFEPYLCMSVSIKYVGTVSLIPWRSLVHNQGADFFGLENYALPLKLTFFSTSAEAFLNNVQGEWYLKIMKVASPLLEIREPNEEIGLLWLESK